MEVYYIQCIIERDILCYWTQCYFRGFHWILCYCRQIPLNSMLIEREFYWLLCCYWEFHGYLHWFDSPCNSNWIWFTMEQLSIPGTEFHWTQCYYRVSHWILYYYMEFNWFQCIYCIYRSGSYIRLNGNQWHWLVYKNIESNSIVINAICCVEWTLIAFYGSQLHPTM